jgi:hypothetical protein
MKIKLNFKKSYLLLLFNQYRITFLRSFCAISSSPPSCGLHSTANTKHDAPTTNHWKKHEKEFVHIQIHWVGVQLNRSERFHWTPTQ